MVYLFEALFILIKNKFLKRNQKNNSTIRKIISNIMKGYSYGAIGP